MTNQQKFEELRSIFARKTEKLVQAEKQLSSILGWGDSSELNEFLNAKLEFEQAGKKYHDFILQAKEKNFLPEQEFSSN